MVTIHMSAKKFFFLFPRAVSLIATEVAEQGEQQTA